MASLEAAPAQARDRAGKIVRQLSRPDILCAT